MLMNAYGLRSSSQAQCLLTILILLVGVVLIRAAEPDEIGREVSIPRHLQDGEEYTIPLTQLVAYGKALFDANWTVEEGGGRPLAKGTGAPLSDSSEPLVFPRNFNRASGPDANSCAGCHNAPYGISGGGGDIVGNVFVLGQRFDFATFDQTNSIPTKSTVDEKGRSVTLQSFANFRATLGMFGSGFIEMLARQMTADLQTIRDATPPGGTNALVSKGVSFGRIIHRLDGSWDVSQTEGLPANTLVASGTNRPSLIVCPFHQAGRVISLREFSNNAFVQHHGIESTERFGLGTDPDGDGHSNEMTRADVTAVSVFQATLSVPGRVIPNDPDIENAVLIGEAKFMAVQCGVCHQPSLPLDHDGWIFTEPNPYNPVGNLRPGDAPTLNVDLTGDQLPPPRLQPNHAGVIYVPAFTDLKLHDITSGPNDPNREPLDMEQPAGSDAFFAGNRRFLTRKLWDAGNKPNHYHHGQYTTLRESILAHAGEAEASREAFQTLSAYEQGCVIEFLKSLQVLRPGTASLVVDEHGEPKTWPPNRLTSIQRIGNTVAVTWQGGTGIDIEPRLYQLERCTNLVDGAWDPVGNPTAATHYTAPPVSPAEFYRVVLLNP